MRFLCKVSSVWKFLRFRITTALQHANCLFLLRAMRYGGQVADFSPPWFVNCLWFRSFR